MMTLAETLSYHVTVLRRQATRVPKGCSEAATVARAALTVADKGLAVIERIRSDDPPSRQDLEAAIVEAASVVAWADHWVGD